MDKQKRIEEMARVIEFCVHKDCESCKRQGNYRCGAYNKAVDLYNADYGNLKEFGEQVLNLISTEMQNLKKCEENLEKEYNHDGAVLHQVRYWELHRLREKIQKLIKEYCE